jgi:hypothetical protein
MNIFANTFIATERNAGNVCQEVVITIVGNMASLDHANGIWMHLSPNTSFVESRKNPGISLKTTQARR